MLQAYPLTKPRTSTSLSWAVHNLGSPCCSPTRTHMGPTLECCLGVVVVVQYPGVQVYNNYPFKSSEQPVSFALTGINTHPSTLPVIRTISVCLCHFVLSFLFQMVSTCLQLGHIGFHWYKPTIDLVREFVYMRRGASSRAFSRWRTGCPQPIRLSYTLGWWRVKYLVHQGSCSQVPDQPTWYSGSRPLGIT